MVAISLFEVPVAAQERFVAEWKPAGAATLYRALRDDVDFRFVAVGRADSASSGFEVVHEDGTPEGAGGVVLINPFAVPDGDDDEFLAGWEGTRQRLVRQRGYLGTRLHRAVGPAQFRFVDVARWSSPLMFARATQRAEFRDAAGALRFASHPALYTVVRA